MNKKQSIDKIYESPFRKSLSLILIGWAIIDVATKLLSGRPFILSLMKFEVVAPVWQLLLLFVLLLIVINRKRSKKKIKYIPVDYELEGKKGKFLVRFHLIEGKPLEDLFGVLICAKCKVPFEHRYVRPNVQYSYCPACKNFISLRAEEQIIALGKSILAKK